MAIVQALVGFEREQPGAAPRRRRPAEGDHRRPPARRGTGEHCALAPDPDEPRTLVVVAPGRPARDAARSTARRRPLARHRRTGGHRVLQASRQGRRPPASRRELPHPPERRRCGDPVPAGPRDRRSHDPRAHPVGSALAHGTRRARDGDVDGRQPHHRRGEGDGDQLAGRPLRDDLRRRPESHPQRPARRPADRRQGDRSGRDVLLQPGDRRAHGGQGVPRGPGHHQRRAHDRARRRRLPGVDDGVQRRVRGRPEDHRPDEPRALHQPLPAGPRRDRRLPGRRPPLRQRHPALAAAPHVRRLVVARRRPLRLVDPSPRGQPDDARSSTAARRR